MWDEDGGGAVPEIYVPTGSQKRASVPMEVKLPVTVNHLT